MIRRPGRFLRRSAMVLAVLYAGVVAVMFALQRDLTYHPAGILPAAAPAGLQDVRFTTDDGVSLAAWYAPPRRPDGLVVVHFHGNGDRIDQIAFKSERFRAAGLGVLWVEFRGYGGLAGQPTEDGLYRDGRAAVGWLAKEGIAARRMVFFGYSLGSGVAVQMASEHPAAALILEAPYTSLPEVAAGHFPFLPARWLMLDRYDSLAKIGRIAAPLLVVHGERDGIIPVGHGRRLAAAAAGPIRTLFLPQADHFNLFSHGAAEAMVDFLMSLPAQAVRP